MPDRRLVRHFLTQFVESDGSSDVDSHQALALVAAGIVTIPLFLTVFMSLRYLTRTFQAPGWTETTGMEDQITFCLLSMLVTAAVAVLQWDALSLTTSDAVILGVLPLRHRDLVEAKVVSLVVFVAMFVTALNLLPTLLHPVLMVATLPLALYMVPVLMAAHAIGITMAAAFGFVAVVGFRELLRLALGATLFRRGSDGIRSVALFVLLVLLAVLPVRLSGRAEWMLQSGPPPIALRPVAWCVAAHAAIAGRVLQRLPRPSMPAWSAVEERQLRTRYEANLPKWTASAVEGAAALAVLIALSLAGYLWNARRLQVLPDFGTGRGGVRLSHVAERLARALIPVAPTRAGFLLLFRTVFGSALHRLYLIVALAAGLGLFVTIAPIAEGGVASPVRVLHLAAQTLLLTAIVAAYRAAIRTAADERAAWLFAVADTGHLAAFRTGVRLAAIVASVAVIAVLAPLHAAAWGLPIASAHAALGVAVGWLLVETVSVTVESPLIVSVPPNDGLNTVGAVFLGALVIGVFVLAAFEQAALRGRFSVLPLTALIAAAAAAIHYTGAARSDDPHVPPHRAEAPSSSAGSLTR